jgi:hypothetical protein
MTSPRHITRSAAEIQPIADAPGPPGGAIPARFTIGDDAVQQISLFGQANP